MYNIALDGPSGAGKSTVARALARELGILYLDTGAMYRAIGLSCLRNNVQPTDAAAVESLLLSTDVSVRYIHGTQRILLNGIDVTNDIRTHEVSKAASDASAIPAVRHKMVELQRKIAMRSNAVLDGRDIGTYVLPNAKYKFYITASIETRAARRHKELCSKGADMPLAKVMADIEQRDKNDSGREFAPLKQADDALLIDTTLLNIDEVIALIRSYIK